ncbi:hypothetical protein O181_069523 [Austropuccinia psidii MF-1]|uniref:Uncharacterized protein n=1 Tax=Austropuccinia psidii MF-1 TaxID=1389203 RepID=A0A9Q3I6F7_9BASI|nr:hypothetical protein [Austropuccinia psidii MF-1]
MECTTIQDSNKIDKGMEQKKEGESKEEAPLASTSNSQANQPPQEAKKDKKKDWKKPYSPSYRILRIQNSFHEKCLQNFQNLDRIQGKRGTEDETNSFSKEVALSPNVVSFLLEIESFILHLKDIENSLLSLK